MEFNEKQALQVIEEMISKTKNEIKDNSFYFLLWGWLVFIAALSEYYLLNFTDFEIHGLLWLILMPLGGVISMIGGMRSRKKDVQVKTYVGENFRVTGRAFGLSLLVICLCMTTQDHFGVFYPTMMVLYGWWLYVSGGMLKFAPLQYGALLDWALAVIGFIVWKDTSSHLLLMAVAVLGGYIIPGYLLKMNYKKHVQGA
jgi:hypothetical protein